MMTDRYSRSKQRSWFVPTLVVIGIAAFFLWESGWRPFELLDVPTGTVRTDSADGADESDDAVAAINPDDQFEPDIDLLNEDDLLHEFSLQNAQRRTESGDVAASSNVAASVSGSSANQVQQAAFESTDTGTDGSQFADFTNPAPPASATAASPPATIDPELGARLRKIDLLLDENDYLTAHRDLSTIYWYQPQHRPHIRQRIEHTSASIYSASQPHYMKPYVVRDGETLGEIAEKYDVPWTYLARLNRVSPERLRAGSKLKVIRGPFNAVVDLKDFRLTIHAHGYYVRHYPIGIGKAQSTPVGEFQVRDKLENPTYFAPEGGVIEADDPTNPLGEFWVGFGDGYGIHGTIEPDSIGKAESRGCIRLRDQDIAEVFDLLTVGSTVLIRR